MDQQNQAQAYRQMNMPDGDDARVNIHQPQQPTSQQQAQQAQQRQPPNDNQKQPYQMPPNGALHTSTPGYKQPRKKKDKNQREKQTQISQQPQQHQSTLRQASGAERPGDQQQEKIPSQAGQPMKFKPEGFVSMARARQHIAQMEAQIMARRNDSICAGSSVTPGTETLRRQHLNLISPPDSEQQQCLNNIERQVLSEMSYPKLPTASFSYARSSSGDPHHTMESQNMQMNNSRFVANQEMIHKILSSSKTHEDIMMMAARDLQSRSGLTSGMGEMANPHMIAARDLQSKPSAIGSEAELARPPPMPRLLQQHMQQSQIKAPSHRQMQRPSSHGQLSQQRLEDEEMLMSAQRDLETRVNAASRLALQHEQQQQLQYRQHQHPPQHQSPSQQRRQMMVPPPRPRQPQHPQNLHQSPLTPQRTQYHTMMLRELEEKVERETMVADAAATQAAASAAGLRDSMDETEESVGYLLKRRNSRASAA